MIMQADRQCTLELEALPSRIQQIRRIVAAQLRYWHLDPLLDTALLGITELLANVYRHAGSDKHCSVQLTLVSGRLTVSVVDSDPQLPQVSSPEPLATGGRGLAMVAALSDSWGADPVPDGGKVVWFSLHVEAPAPAPRRRPAARRVPAVAAAA
ncbi:ATP-binding protein [Streptomyces sp. RKAG337]|nr:ATP-binding protein [Streptomyces sp. RKAG337]MCM2429788.1 ATP-binding protein [Streptomyces sp. RKAG337]